VLKKLLLMTLLVFVGVQAQDNSEVDVDFAFEQLVYVMGMSLAEQNTIVDEVSAQKAILALYEDVEQVALITDVFLQIDNEMLEHNVNTVEDLIAFELKEHHDLAMAIIILLATYQDVFMIFKNLHPQDISFEAWCKDLSVLSLMSDEDELIEAGYFDFYQACVLMLEAQNHLEYELKALES